MTSSALFSEFPYKCIYSSLINECTNWFCHNYLRLSSVPLNVSNLTSKLTNREPSTLCTKVFSNAHQSFFSLKSFKITAKGVLEKGLATMHVTQDASSPARCSTMPASNREQDSLLIFRFFSCVGCLLPIILFCVIFFHRWLHTH